MKLSTVKNLIKSEEKISIKFLKEFLENGNTIPELEGYDFYDNGLSSLIFKKKNKIIGLTIDIAKINYLKKESSLKVNFKRMFILKHKDIKMLVFIYEMPFFKKIDEFINKSDIGVIEVLCNVQYPIPFLKENEGLIINLDNLNKVKEKYPCREDLCSEQFVRNEEGALLCIDPILGSNIRF